jgi:hypothetical protein
MSIDESKALMKQEFEKRSQNMTEDEKAAM